MLLCPNLLSHIYVHIQNSLSPWTVCSLVQSIFDYRFSSLYCFKQWIITSYNSCHTFLLFWPMKPMSCNIWMSHWKLLIGSFGWVRMSREANRVCGRQLNSECPGSFCWYGLGTNSIWDSLSANNTKWDIILIDSKCIRELMLRWSLNKDKFYPWGSCTVLFSTFCSHSFIIELKITWKKNQIYVK